MFNKFLSYARSEWCGIAGRDYDSRVQVRGAYRNNDYNIFFSDVDGTHKRRHEAAEKRDDIND